MLTKANISDMYVRAGSGSEYLALICRFAPGGVIWARGTHIQCSCPGVAGKNLAQTPGIPATSTPWGRADATNGSSALNVGHVSDSAASGWIRARKRNLQRRRAVAPLALLVRLGGYPGASTGVR